MLMRQRLLDIVPAIALVLALGIVFAVDRGRPASPARDGATEVAEVHLLDVPQSLAPRRDPVKTLMPEVEKEFPTQRPISPKKEVADVQQQDNKKDVQEQEIKKDQASNNQPPPKKNNPKPRPDSIYAERVAENRVETAKQQGGSTISEKAVTDGLEWLARHQAEDGSWSNTCLGAGVGSRCENNRSCSHSGQAFAVAHTGLALLAFQGGGHFYFNDTPYSAQVKRGLDWLIAQQIRDGCFENRFREEVRSPDGKEVYFQRGNCYMYEHAIATFALGEACALAKHSQQAPDRKYSDALEKAIKFIEDSQDPAGGGWRYVPMAPGDASVSGWVVLAMKSAQAAEVKVNPTTLTKCIHFFKNLEYKAAGQTAYAMTKPSFPLIALPAPFIGSEATTGVGMLVHHFLLEQSESELLKKASAHLASYAKETWGGDPKPVDGDVNFSRLRGRRMPIGEERLLDRYYIWYNCTLGMYLTGGENWDQWNGVVRDAVIRSQATNGCERGSWQPYDPFDKVGGRIYTTSLAILTLEVYYRFAKKEHVAANMLKQVRALITEGKIPQAHAALLKLIESYPDAAVTADARQLLMELPAIKRAQDERLAATGVSQIKSLIVEDKLPQAEALIREIIEKYPDAAAIPEARQILMEMPSLKKKLDERLAANMLNPIRAFINQEKLAQAEEASRKLIERYPETAAAVEAREILMKMPVFKRKLDERLASDSLRQIKILIANDKISTAKTLLNKLINTFPDTMTTIEARQILKDL